LQKPRESVSRRLLNGLLLALLRLHLLELPQVYLLVLLRNRLLISDPFVVEPSRHDFP
jgi:hypothetical protein